MARGKSFPSQGKVNNFPSSRKSSFSPKPFISWENSAFQGKGKAIFKGKLSPQREHFSSLRENPPNLPLEGKICPQKMFRVISVKLVPTPGNSTVDLR